MEQKGPEINSIARFSGFAHIYDQYRPEAPKAVVEIILRYLGRNPSIVIDLGSGTGLSSFIWSNHADQVMGIEPNDDMRRKAMEKLGQSSDSGAAGHISFVKGYSNQLDIPANTVDVITCSQSFHFNQQSGYHHRSTRTRG